MGWHVFPARVVWHEDIQKKRATFPGKWAEISTTDPNTISAWFGPTGLARDGTVCIDTGKSGLVVVDLDGRAGRETWERLVVEHGVSATLRVRTPSGGQHWYYRADEAHPVANTQPGKDGAGRLGPGVDVRGVGGLIFAPPSSDDRGRYSWVEGAPQSPLDLASVPRVVWQRSPLHRERVELAAPQPVASSDPFTGPEKSWTPEAAERLLGERLTAFRDMRTPQDHGFNPALNELAMLFGHFVGGGAIKQREARERLHEAAEHNGSVKYQGEDGVLATIRSGLAAGMREPWTVLADDFAEVEAESGATGERERTSSDPIDWTEAFARDFSQADWLPGRLCERGQQVALVGAGKAGKSLVMLDWVLSCVTGRPFLGQGEPTEPVRVIYADRENSLRDIVTRARALGISDPNELRNLIYYSFPTWAPLDTNAGALEFLGVVASQHKAEPVALCVLDTASRYIEGDENDSSPWLALYRLAQARLKSLGIACWRIDHFGKDDSKGARGSGAKSQDVDHVWELRVTGEETEGLVTTTVLKLERTHTRSGLGPSELEFTRVGQYTSDDRDGWLDGGTSHKMPDPFAPPPPVKLPEWVENLTENQGEVLAALRDHSDKLGATRAQVLGWLKERRSKQERPAMPVTSYDSAVRSLVDKELVTRKGAKVYLVAYLEDDGG
jgi:hypothetical protein